LLKPLFSRFIFLATGTFIMNYSMTRKGIGLSAVIAGLLAVAPVASAIEVDMSGHVDRMIRAADNDGSGGGSGIPRGGSDWQHLDNGADQSRLDIIGTQEMNDGEAGVEVEMRIGDTSECYDIKQDVANQGSAIGGNGGNSTSCDQTVEWSRADAWYEGGWGKVSLGKGDSASRGSDRADLSGTDLGFNYDNRRNASLTYFVPSGGSSGLTYGDAFLMYEGQRSQNRVRYDSPVWGGLGGGFQFKISTANTEKYAIGATWASEEDKDFQLRVAAGYTDVDNPTTGPGVGIPDTLVSISASAMLKMGLSFTAGYGSAGVPDALAGPGVDDQTNIHFKVGYLFGDNIAVAIRYMVGEEVGFVSGIDSDALGIGAEWTANEWLDVYGSIERSSLDASVGGSSQDLTVGLVGLKVSF
jgi:predicted porin